MPTYKEISGAQVITASGGALAHPAGVPIGPFGYNWAFSGVDPGTPCYVKQVTLGGDLSTQFFTMQTEPLDPVDTFTQMWSIGLQSTAVGGSVQTSAASPLGTVGGAVNTYLYDISNGTILVFWRTIPDDPTAHLQAVNPKDISLGQVPVVVGGFGGEYDYDISTGGIPSEYVIQVCGLGNNYFVLFEYNPGNGQQYYSIWYADNTSGVSLITSRTLWVTGPGYPAGFVCLGGYGAGKVWGYFAPAIANTIYIFLIEFTGTPPVLTAYGSPTSFVGANPPSVISSSVPYPIQAARRPTDNTKLDVWNGFQLYWEAIQHGSFPLDVSADEQRAYGGDCHSFFNTDTGGPFYAAATPTYLSDQTFMFNAVNGALTAGDAAVSFYPAPGIHSAGSGGIVGPGYGQQIQPGRSQLLFQSPSPFFLSEANNTFADGLGNAFVIAPVGPPFPSFDVWRFTAQDVTLSPCQAPPTRQKPRDDNLALGAVRQAGTAPGPSSVQHSKRVGVRGTYS
jgi:hypothetical protein